MTRKARNGREVEEDKKRKRRGKEVERSSLSFGSEPRGRAGRTEDESKEKGEKGGQR